LIVNKILQQTTWNKINSGTPSCSYCWQEKFNYQLQENVILLLLMDFDRRNWCNHVEVSHESCIRKYSSPIHDFAGAETSRQNFFSCHSVNVVVRLN